MRNLHIYDSLSQQKKRFQPRVANKVSLYVCGITVYDYCHVGHARMIVVFDMVARYLRANGYELNYVRNITDIDDKIIKRAEENKESIGDLTARFIDAMYEDFAKLNVLRPTQEPRATEHIASIIELIQKLIQNDKAYAASNGDVYYAVNQFPSCGKLSHKDIAGLRAGERVEVNENKRDPLDFVLWKAAKPSEPRWASPWGEGRPGWHIECSAMSMHCLGEEFDIHGGGFDSMFPHHENEIAQSEGATGKGFAALWMHNGFVQINEEKMSKSLGNFFTIHDVLAEHEPEVVRYFILASHYRSPINYSSDSLTQARESLSRWYTALRDLPMVTQSAGLAYRERFWAAMDDDFNTPEAFAVLFDLAREINRQREQDIALAAALGLQLKELGGVLGLLESDPNVFLQQTGDAIDAQTIEALIQRRSDARVARDFKEADRLRDELTALGVVLEDKEGQTRWRRG